jgi:hypothetical protein
MHFVHDLPLQGLKPNARSFLAARLKLCPDRKPKLRNKSFLLLESHTLGHPPESGFP